jgi:hypothetical protein
MRYLVVVRSERYGFTASEVQASDPDEAADKAASDELGALGDGDWIHVYGPGEGQGFEVAVKRDVTLRAVR